MASEVILPRQGQSVETCLLVDWKVRVGESVRAGDALCQVETDKAVFDVEAPRDGTLLKIYHQEGEDVPVLSLLALLGEPDEDVSAWEQAKAAPSLNSAEKRRFPEAAAVAPVPPSFTGVEAGPSGGPKAAAISPRARRLAGELGTDTSALAGSGPGGRIIERDVRRRAEERQPLTPAARALLENGELVPPAGGSGIGGRVRAEDLFPAAEQGAFQDLSLSVTRRRIAERLLSSLNTSAQFTLHASADAEALLALRAELKQRSGEEARITLNDLILFAVSRVLGRFPDLNSHFLGDRVRRFEQVHLGFAVDSERGLLVPVIRGASSLSALQISREAGRLASACREKQVTPDDLSGGTFTVTNLGGQGVESFTPLLNPPQVGILGVGRIGLKPVEAEEGVRFVHSLPLSLTVDHQAVDGGPAARFLAAMSEAIAAFRTI